MLEIISAAVLALVFFAGLFWLMNRFFPIGPGLETLVTGESGQGNGALSISRSLWVASGDNESGLSAQGGNYVAKLSRVHRDVRSKKADAIAWRSAYKGLELFDKDSIQTFTKSTAVIRFDEHNELELGPNSLIIIKRSESDLIWPERRAFMVMVDGELRGKVKASGKKPLFVEIETPNAVASVQSSSATGDVNFEIKVSSDSSSRFTVFGGIATVEGAGHSVKINANETTVVEGDAAPAIPEPLPEQIRLDSPRDNKQYIYRELPPPVKFSWKKDEYAASYRFVLARDETFNQIVFEDDVKRNRFEHGNLKEGHYFWRVIGVNSNGGEGMPSEPLRIQIRQDLEPPKIDIDFPEVALDQRKYTVSGATEVGSKLFIDGEVVAVGEDGQFSYDIELRPGINVVVIEAIDEAGNVTYKSETVHGKF